MQKVREEMGLRNLKRMIPFCRTVEEGRRVLAEMARHGLTRQSRHPSQISSTTAQTNSKFEISNLKFEI